MERTKQLVWSTFKTPFGRKYTQFTESHDEAASKFASPPSCSYAHPASLTLPQKFEARFGANSTPASQHAKPSTNFLAELPPRPQTESIFAKSGCKASITNNTTAQPPTSPVTPPLSPGPRAMHYLNPTCNCKPIFFTPPNSPIRNNVPPLFPGSDRIPHRPKQDSVPSPPYSVEDPLSTCNSFVGCSPLSPTQTFLVTLTSDRSFSPESSRPMPDRLADRFAKLRVGTGAPPISPQSEPHLLPLGCEDHYMQPNRSRERLSSNLQTTATASPPIRRRPVAGASPTSTDRSRAIDTDQISFLNRKRHSIEDEDEDSSRCQCQINAHRRASRLTTQLRNSPSKLPVKTSLPGRTANRALAQQGTIGRGHSLRSFDDLEYPDLAGALALSAAEARQSRGSPVEQPNIVRVNRNAAVVQEERDRQLAEALQKEEEGRYDELLVSMSDADYDDNEISFFRQLQHIAGQSAAHPLEYGTQIALTSGGRNARYFRSATRTLPIEFSSDESDPDVEMGENSGKEDAAIQRVDTVDRTRSEQGSTAVKLECAVCSETIPIAGVPYLASCTHEPSTCRDCFAVWIESELGKKGWQSIKCPGSGCRVLLAHGEVQEYATKEVFDQYDAFAIRAALGNDPSFRWCRAAGCNSGQIHLSGEDGNIFRCVACGHRVCVIHNETFHEGETCQEFDYRTSGRKEREEEASERAVKKLSKVCVTWYHSRTNTNKLLRNAQGEDAASASRRTKAATI